LAHITGGGIIDNLPRILPDGVGAIIRQGTWQVPPIFTLIQKLGAVDDAEMFRVFNMGLGLLAVIPGDEVQHAQGVLTNECFHVGEIVSGRGAQIV
jgi:phosphoribosylformylglycinamidine cyclo-ligase